MRKGFADQSTVFIVDDAAGALDDAARVLKDAGFATQIVSTASVAAGLSSSSQSACVLSDLHARGLDALQLPQALAETGCTAPVIFLTDRMDVRGSVMAMKAGAMHVLGKPIDRDELLNVIRAAMARDLAARLSRTLDNERRQRYALLTPREHEVCGWVSAGLKNKQIAARLGIALRTVKIYRGQTMRKLGVRSVPELVRVVDRVRPEQADPRSFRRSSAQPPTVTAQLEHRV